MVEASIRLLRALIQYGWKGKTSKELSHQLLIFITFVIGGVPGQDKKRDVPEETVLEGYRTLASLVGAIGSASLTAVLTSEQIVPTLGHAISVLLDGVVDGATPEIQLAALDCLESFYVSIREHAVLASFLPGTVSSLAKTLSPPQSLKSQKRVLIRGLSVLGAVIFQVLGDLRTRNILKEEGSESKQEEGQGDSAKELTPAWLKATASQIKIALSSVLKLRTHQSEEVQWAVNRLCIGILDECHASLAECKTILVETAMMVDNGEATKSIYHTSLEDLTSIYPELGDAVRVVLYNWVTELPRIMQSNDEQAKQQAIRHFLRGNKLAASSGLESSTLEGSLVDSLRDSVVALMLGSRTQRIMDNAELDDDPWKSASLIRTSSPAESPSLRYPPVILDRDNQQQTRNEILSLIENIGSPSRKTKLAADMLSYLQDSAGVDQLASFWLSFEIIKSSYSSPNPPDVDTLLDFADLDDSGSQSALLQELYDFSASVLTSHSDAEEVDWRLEAFALEVAAFAAARMQAEFRPELIDVLFPITSFMGSRNPRLRTHAITTLNTIAAACGYATVSDLIVDNADYMVNSVSLRLNTFDISPASMRVLKMMIRLTGPKLIPFLDDVVASVFAGLDNYHGYPIFVESLFSVLSEVVEQGAKSDILLIEGTKRIDHKKRPPEPEGIRGALDALAQRAKRKAEEPIGEKREGNDKLRGHPKEPWGPPKSEPKSFVETLAEQQDESGGDEDDEPSQDVDKPKTPATPTYTLLTRITTLTQHYLTSPTPTLRKSLLDLLGTVSPALAPDEDTFLPTVNALWPVVIARLHDSEPFVVIAACKALSTLCESAGDFLSSRIKTEWSNWLSEWCGKARQEALKAGWRPGATRIPDGRALRTTSRASGQNDSIILPSRGVAEPSAGDRGLQLVQSTRASAPVQAVATTAAREPVANTHGLGRFAQASQVWEATKEFLGAVASFVRIDDDIFDDMLNLLRDDILLGRTESVVRAFEDVNADAVWLVRYAGGVIECGPAPRIEGVEFAPGIRLDGKG